MLKKRKQYNNEFKFRVALEACKGQKTLNELATIHGIHPNQISSLDGHFCLSALHKALRQEQPAIFNTDQGSLVHRNRLYFDPGAGRYSHQYGWLRPCDGQHLHRAVLA